ncbi:hypothetical protein K8R62_00315 [bacterium]|nr:hypothetical protein [bacterium]
MEQENVQPSNGVLPKLSSIEDLFKNSFELYKKGFLKLIGLFLISILAVIPVAALLLIWGILAYFGLNNIVLNIALGFIGIVLLIVSVIYVSVSAQAGTFLYFKKDYPKPGVFALFNEARKKYFFSFLWVSALTGILVFLGFIFLFIPGIILLVYYSFSVWVFMFEDKKGYEALKGSMNLVKGYWWGVAGRFALLYFVFYFVFAVPSFFINGDLALQVWSSLVQLVSFLIAPFFLCYQYLIYKDLVKLKFNKK